MCRPSSILLLFLGLYCGDCLAFSPVQRYALSPLNARIFHKGVRSKTAHSDTRLESSQFVLHSTSSAAAAWAAGHIVGGSLGTPVVAKAIKGWYKKIDLPSWTPPDRIFAPVWTLLYASMGISAFRIYSCVDSLKTLPMVLWFSHCIGNLIWAPVFFGFKRLQAGLVINCLLLASLGWILPVFYQLDRVASLLLLPYTMWLLFATTLNYAICKRNPSSDGYNNAMFQDDLSKLQNEAAKYAGL